MATGSQAPLPFYMDLPRFVLNHGTYDENKPILIDATAPERVITKAQAKEMVEKTARGLQAVGLERGDTVCVVHLNDIMYPVVFLAIIMAGGVFSGVNPMYKVGELCHHFEVSEAKFVLSGPASLAAVFEASEGLLDAGNIIVWGEGEAGASTGARHSLASLMAGPAGASVVDPVIFDDETLAKNTVAVLMSTSGTTGLPKMAARSHSSLVTENLALQEKSTKNYHVVRLLFTPFFHGFTAPLALVDALVSGHTTYIMPRFNLEACVEYVERYEVTEMAAPPPVLLAFWGTTEHERKALHLIRTVWSGGAPMSAAHQKKALGMFHKYSRIVQVYGMTEAGWITTFRYPELDETGSVGSLLPSYEAKIIRADGSDGRTGQEGMLHVKGPINMLGYYNNPSATSNTLQDGWLSTGDIGYFSHDQKLYLTDRQKDIIKFRGWQISPTEIEACLLANDLVADVGVFGHILSEIQEEVPVAHIVLKAGMPEYAAQFAIMQELRDHCYKRLTKYKVIALEMRFKTNIPKNPAGKILRREMHPEEVFWRWIKSWLNLCKEQNAGPPEEMEVTWEEAENDDTQDDEAKRVEEEENNRLDEEHEVMVQMIARLDI
ncbi:acetyl-CoA synthetase-like protein [Aureobasidium pullulans]|nr:acetyl-CoA synthetase-like protein [Aureobasidium pullulans]